MKHIITFLYCALFCTGSLWAQVAICDNYLSVSLDAQGEAFIGPEIFDGGSYDYDNLTVSQSLFTCADLGDLQVILTAHNGSNTNQCTVEVTIHDKLAPFVICQPDGAVVVPVIGGVGTLQPEMLQQDMYENCTITSMVASQTVFDGTEGTPTVSLTITDQSGNQAFCNTVIQVGGVHQAYLNCKTAIDFAIIAGETRVVELADVLEYGPFPTWDLALVITDSNGAVVPDNELSGNDVGQTYTATVSDPITGATCTCTITIEEPSINCHPGLNVDLLPWASEIQLYVSDFDNGSSAFDSMWLSQSLFDCDDLGQTQVTVYGQIGTTIFDCTSTLTLNDNAAPVAICETDIVIALDANGQATITVDMVDDGSYDNCGIASMTLNQTTFDTTSEATEVVILEIEDLSGNVNSCWTNVHILGIGNPNLTCNSYLTIGLPSSGTYTPNIQILIEGGPFYGWDLSYFLLDPINDTIPNNTITTAHLNQELTFIVTENNSGVSCFGTIFVDGTIPNDCSSFFICDSKPWNTPIGNCTSGHTLEDFVEWPANIDIASCYYSPNYLEDYTTVGWNNARPRLAGDCAGKGVHYTDEVFTLPDDEIRVMRTWTIVDWVTLNQWNYTQILLIDQADCNTPVIVKTMSGQGIEGVNVYETITTDNQGEAIITNNRYNNLSPSLQGELGDGVDLHDALAIQEFINGSRTFTNLQTRLSDFNNDAVVDIRDVLDIQKIGLDVLDPATPEPWLFFGAKSDPSDYLNVSIAAGDYYGGPVDIIGGKRGDINGDATNFGQLNQQLNEVAIDLYVTDELLYDGGTHNIDFFIDDLENIGGQQLELVLDLNKIEIKQLTSPAFEGFSEANYKITDEGILKIYWQANDDMIINGGTTGSREVPILSIELIALKNSILSTTMNLNQSQRNSIARVGSDNRYAFNMNWIDRIISNTATPQDALHIMSIAPNPGDDFMTFTITSGRHTQHVMDIFNSLGQKVKQINIDGDQTTISTSDWNSGVYYFHLSNELGSNHSGVFSIQHK